jgi:hypothetical protein
VESRLQAKQLFAFEGAPLASAEPFVRARPAADKGDPDAEYLGGVAAMLDPSLGVSTAKAGEFLLGSARDGDPQSQYWVGIQLRATVACHPHADGAVWLRHAAEGGSAAAQLMLARDLLAAQPAAAQAAQAQALLRKASSAESYYVRKHVAALLAASPVEAVRDPPTALNLAHQLAAGEIQSDPQMFEVVAAASAANGDFHAAVAQQQIAIRKAQGLGWNTRAMQERLDTYRARRGWQGELFASALPGA